MSGSRLDPWVDSYAERTQGMTASEIRALFAVASRPEVVSLAGGMPFVQALSMDLMADPVAKLIRERGATALQYGSGQGDVTLREQILEVMEEVKVTAHPDDIIVTTGSQMALDLVTRVFCDPGDVVLVKASRSIGLEAVSSAPTSAASCMLRWMMKACHLQLSRKQFATCAHQGVASR